ncbi:MAG: nucleotidyltransferase domain-containing protein [Clostridiales bacterium]|nr:nucleotidyltransferase domain-containing protein [Clostridiales bacterium]
MREDLYNKIALQIFSYLTMQPEKTKCTVTGISKTLKVSKGSVSNALTKYSDLGMIFKTNVGKSVIHEVNMDNPINSQFRKFDNLLKLQPLINVIKNKANRIILFGSCASGTDKINSDIDLFVLVDNEFRAEIEKKIYSYEIDRKINPVIVDEFELIDLETEDKAFYKEISKGIEIWGGEI